MCLSNESFNKFLDTNNVLLRTSNNIHLAITLQLLLILRGKRGGGGGGGGKRGEKRGTRC